MPGIYEVYLVVSGPHTSETLCTEACVAADEPWVCIQVVTQEPPCDTMSSMCVPASEFLMPMFMCADLKGPYLTEEECMWVGCVDYSDSASASASSPADGRWYCMYIYTNDYPNPGDRCVGSPTNVDCMYLLDDPGSACIAYPPDPNQSMQHVVEGNYATEEECNAAGCDFPTSASASAEGGNRYYCIQADLYAAEDGACTGSVLGTIGYCWYDESGTGPEIGGCAPISDGNLKITGFTGPFEDWTICPGDTL